MERQSTRKVMVVMMVIMVVMMIRLFLDPPPEMKEIVNGARKAKWSCGMVAINLMSFFQKLLEERMVKIRNRYGKTLKTSIFIL